MNIIQSNLFNLTCTGRECLCRNRQSVGLHSVNNLDIHSQGNVCICLWLFVPLANFALIWRRHHCRWRATFFFTLARHSWPLSSKCFLANQLWYGTSVYKWGCQYLFLRLMSRLGFEQAPFRLRRERSSPLRHRRGHKGIKVHFAKHC